MYSLEWSVGCNNPTKHHKAALVNSASDIEYIMGWTKEQTSQKIEQQQSLFGLSDTRGTRNFTIIIKQNKSRSYRCVGDKNKQKHKRFIAHIAFYGI